MEQPIFLGAANSPEKIVVDICDEHVDVDKDDPRMLPSPVNWVRQYPAEGKIENISKWKLDLIDTHPPIRQMLSSMVGLFYHALFAMPKEDTSKSEGIARYWERQGMCRRSRPVLRAATSQRALEPCTVIISTRKSCAEVMKSLALYQMSNGVLEVCLFFLHLNNLNQFEFELIFFFKNNE
ncbi:hypothetical protein RFI_23485 [Reticulomyxa filosa]|uniref:Uncharacterized protein n=1 Tax=Reticulomyxa filosa TaxID=46433 RepID=X6MIS9_RETFI|nr:hypothetical protein RFI_23485 [Reticulomyxa filosa]|eukprot:ETO13883.1 hypothetical protein RFI_23485 [Reticulomyxa filosa]